MIRNPFALFAPFEEIEVVLFTKEDNRPTSEEISKIFGANGVTALEQVHGNKTIRVDAPMELSEKADGLMSDKKNLVLTIRTADCQSFIIFAPEHHMLGMLHVGWRGLIADAIPAFYRMLADEWYIDPRETYVAAGPSLCTQCADFTDPLRELPTIDQKFIHGKYADLRGAADAQFFDLGLPPQNFERHPDCTRCSPETYWTYRGGDREQVRTGKTNVLACALRKMV